MYKHNQDELEKGFWAGNNIVVCTSDKSKRPKSRAGEVLPNYFFKKTLGCFKHRAYRSRDLKPKVFGPSGLATGCKPQSLRRRKKSSKRRLDWQSMISSSRGPQPMPDVRPSKRVKELFPTIVTTAATPSPPRRNCTTLPLDQDRVCKFRVTVFVGVPVDSLDGWDRWIMQVNVPDHCGHFPHKCTVQGKPLRLKDQREVRLAVQVQIAYLVLNTCYW